MTEKKKGITIINKDERSRVRRLYETLKVFGQPKAGEPLVKEAKTAVLGVVEQNYGIYETPSFRSQVQCFWNDPLINEAITMFAEQVVATGAFLTYNPEYLFKIGGKTAFDVIKLWYDVNNVDTKLLEIAIELKAFGNSFWRISEFGFSKIPIEAVWHMVRVSPEEPLQEKYNMQLHPMYGGKIMHWEEFIHFRRNITGYHAPFGHGVIYALLATPTDSSGNIAPSIYDIRLTMRGSLNEGFKKFSFGNELWCFPEMSNEDFAATDADNKTIGQRIAEMSSTGNRIATNVNGKVELAVPERTQSYDSFIKNMRDEFFMSLADPSLKLGLEQGFTKATSVTASEVYKFKIATQRKVIKEKFEDLFKQILDKQGYDGTEAGIQLNFGPEEIAVYDIADIFAAVNGSKPVITANEARKLLAKYHKWDITGDIEGGDSVIPAQVPETTKAGKTPTESLMKRQEESAASAPNPQIVVTPLSDALARYNGDITKVFIDPLVPESMYGIFRDREIFQWQLEFMNGLSYKEAEQMADVYEKSKVLVNGGNWEEHQVKCTEILKLILAREEKVQNPSDCVIHEGE